jgi:(p)ppGpp synthase/HD superfamily hydrolase
MYSQRLERAIRMAFSAHAWQVRKAEPQVAYATHPVHVAIMVQEAGGDEDTVISAMLHDLLEDTTVTPEELEDEFGPRVLSIVQEVSEDKSLPWGERKRRMVERLRIASPEACMVAAADKIHNMETLVDAHRRFGPAVWNAFRGRPEETMRFNDEVFRALRGRVPDSLETAYELALNAGYRLLAPSV